MLAAHLDTKPKYVALGGHRWTSQRKVLLSTMMSRASGNKRLGAIHTAAVPEKQMGLSGSVKNQTNFICSQLAKYYRQ